MPTYLTAADAARAHRALDSLHSLIYFAPEAEEELTGVGLRPGRMCYFASRSAPMGPVSPGVVAATFYNFNPALIRRHIPRAWTLASAEDVVAARFRAVDRAYQRLLGDETANGAAVFEAAELTRVATEGLPVGGRPLFAAHADLDWPEAPHLALWHAISLLREFRGDGHVVALLAGGLTGLEALVTHTATGRGFTVEAAKATRGWSDEEWAAAEQGLRARGLVNSEGLTPAGVAVRDAIEAETDRLALEPWLRLGADRLARLIELGKELSRAALGAGAFPTGVFATKK
ncbi:MAG TPA: hypothetical protein VGN18_02040 [Jatrophihabitans sp.]|jgi:hypothetical protein|uniref:SCO6745 family protein n=1 Tax=Jatrophihabitans sp. TaxID=1932789 RepID=UPI002DFED175|nr:hypothetical protein [Jatrophihabitans sp.]